MNGVDATPPPQMARHGVRVSEAGGTSASAQAGFIFIFFHCLPEAHHRLQQQGRMEVPNGKKGRPKGTGLAQDDAVVAEVVRAEVAAMEREATLGVPQRFNRAAALRKALGRHPEAHELSRLQQKIRRGVAEAMPNSTWVEVKAAGCISDAGGALELLDTLRADLVALGFSEEKAHRIVLEALNDALTMVRPLAVEVSSPYLRGHEFGSAYGTASGLGLDAMVLVRSPRTWNASVDSGSMSLDFRAAGDEEWCVTVESLQALVDCGQVAAAGRILGVFDNLVFDVDAAFSPEGPARAACAEMFPELAEELARAPRVPILGEAEREEMAEFLRSTRGTPTAEERLLRAMGRLP